MKMKLVIKNILFIIPYNPPLIPYVAAEKTELNAQTTDFVFVFHLAGQLDDEMSEVSVNVQGDNEGEDDVMSGINEQSEEEGETGN